jgi:hypothetical protein
MPDDIDRLEVELRGLAPDFDARLGDRDLSTAVLDRITANDAVRTLRPVPDASEPTIRTRRRRPRRVAVLIAATLAVGVLAIPPARAAIARFFRIGSAEIHRDPPPADRATVPTLAPGAPLPDLGEQSTLAAVRRRMPTLALPTIERLGPPDEVWHAPQASGKASLVYTASDDLPPAANTPGIGLLVQEFAGDGRTFVEKYLQEGTDVEAVTVGDEQGIFVSGDTHAIWYTAPDGTEYSEVGRLVGNALIFPRGDLTIRLEGDLSRDEMLEIANSLQ